MQPSSFSSALPYSCSCEPQNYSFSQTMTIESMSPEESNDLTLYFEYQDGLFQINDNQTASLVTYFNGQFASTRQLDFNAMLNEAKPQGPYEICQIAVDIKLGLGQASDIEFEFYIGGLSITSGMNFNYNLYLQSGNKKLPISLGQCNCQGG
ncbi:hypothetical protein KIH87_15400 [Paraneptunicella aestuarii]|uniref:hypothetical protein n=1 Tax=Paraneptunicella aestuarii TaxID=2831148 RepID=UPI001E5A3E16|nr:hypothetical protein [Paraneptunicella aestuarii]UAA38063.1 hypothetical protein KIH87_15400 [Paraneptunicella aestuarii]